MGTVPTPIRPGASTAATSAQPGSWCDAIIFALKPPACRAITNALINITASTNTVIPFGSDTLDQVQSGDAEMHSTSTNTSRITIRTAGVYAVHGQVQLSTTGSGSIAIQKNGVTVSTIAVASISGQTSIPISDLVPCTVGDYIELMVSTTAASSITTAWPTWINVHWMSN